MSWEILAAGRDEGKVKFHESREKRSVHIKMAIKKGSWTKPTTTTSEMEVYENGKRIFSSLIVGYGKFPYSAERCTFTTRLKNMPEDSVHTEFPREYRTTQFSLEKYISNEFGVDIESYEKKTRDILGGWCG